MMLYEKLIYPCGTIIEQKAQTWSLLGLIFSYTTKDDKPYPVCPLHGNKCRK